MSTTRRTFLAQAGLLGGAALLGDGAFRPAAADKPVNFAGWVFKPDTVKDYVDYGLNHLVFHAPGEDQERFLSAFEKQVMPGVRAF